MSEHPDHHSVRRVTPPGGRSIEVVGSPRTAAGSARELHVCLQCGSGLVQPIDWTEAAGHSWELTLRCPNCGWGEVGKYERRKVEDLEEQLDVGLTAMLEDLRRLTQDNMAADIDRFVAALRADLILPEDF